MSKPSDPPEPHAGARGSEPSHDREGVVVPRCLEDRLQDTVLTEYRNPFAGFSDDEMAILDGIMLEPIPAGESGGIESRSRGRR